MKDFNSLLGRLRLRHFDFLDRLGKEANLGRVATEMNMVHSTATKMLQDIEDTLGLALFTRNRRGIRATAEGETMIKLARLILSDLRAGHAELAIVEKGGVGLIRIGVFPVAAAELLPALYSQLRQSAPRLDISIEEGDELRLAERLSGGNIDLILGRIDAGRLTPDLRHRVLYYEETVVVCGADNPIADAAAEDLPRLMSQAEWILPTTTTGASRMVSTWIVNAGFSPPRIGVESISALTTAGLLSKTALLGIFPLSVARSFTELGMLRQLSVSLPKTEFPVGVIYRRAQEQSPIIQTLIDHCITATRHLS